MRVCNTRRSARSRRGDRKTPMAASAGFQLDSPVFACDFACGCRGVQSFGGKTTCQNIGLGSMNSTPT